MDGGKTNGEGLSKEFSRLYTAGNPLSSVPTSMQVSQRGAGANMSVDVAAGDVHLIYPSGNGSAWSWSDAVNNILISTANPTNPRIDVIYCWIDTSAFTPASNNNPGAFKFAVSTGTASATPSANSDATIQAALGASVPFIRLATVLVGAAVSSITTANVTDARTTLKATTTSNVSVTNTGWNTLNGVTLSSVTYLGNRSYSATTSSDISGTVSPGNRLMFQRATSSPTQCASFNGTTQFYNNTTPAGMTFTDDFVVSAWVKLSSYPASVEAAIASRYNTASGGWTLNISSSGQVLLVGYSGASSNASYVQSYQSIPLNKWVHVTAQLDMSAFTATTTTSYVMIDGVDVPASVARFGTNPTALTSGVGNLEIGSYSGGTKNFPGKIAQVFVTSAKLTQTQVRSIYSQAISTADTVTYNMVSAYSLSNSITDLNTVNANNLTANGAVVATNADSFSGQQASATISATLDYGILQAITSSTITWQVPEGNTVTTNGTITALSYSNVKAPYGMSTQEDKWTLLTLILAPITHTASAASTIYNIGGTNLNIPVGAWKLSAQLAWQSASSNTISDINSALSTSASSYSDYELVTRFYQNSFGAAQTTIVVARHEKSVTVSSPTTYYALFLASQPQSTNPLLNGAVSTINPQLSYINAKNTYL